MSNLPYDPNQQPSILQNLNSGIEASQNMKFRAALGVADIGMRKFNTNNAPKIDAGKDIDKLKKGIEETNEQLTKTQKLTETTFDKFGKSIKDVNAKNLKETDTLLGNIGKKIEGLQKTWEPSNNAVGTFRKSLLGVEKTMEKIAGIKFGVDSVKILTGAFSQLGDEIARVNSTMQIMATAGVDPSVIASIKEFQAAITNIDVNNVEQMAAGFVGQYAQVTQQLARIGTLIPEEIKKATSKGEDFLGDYFDNIQNMVNKSLKNTVTSMEAVDATYTAMQAGIGAMPNGGTNQAVVDKTVTDALKLVATQGGDVNQVMELLVQTMTAFGMSTNSSGEILAKLTKLVDVGITSIPELSSGFGQLGVTASSAGVTLDEMTGSLAALTLAGSNTFSAMTSLQNVYNKIVSGTVSDRLAEMNATLDGQAVRLDSSTVATKGFVQAIADVDRAIGGSKESWQKVMGGDQEAVRGIFGLLKKDVKGLQDVIDQVANTSASYLEEAFNIKIDTDKVMQFSQALNKVSEIGLKLGKILTPLFSKGLERIDAYADRIEYLVKNYGDVILKIVEMQLALKTLNGIFGILIGTLGKLLGAYGMWLIASGKLAQNFFKIVGMLREQNAVVKANNMLWDQNTSMVKKVLAVLGQLLGFYDLEKAGKDNLTKADKKRIDSEAQTRAVKAAAHKDTMAELEKEIAMYEKVAAVRAGKGTGKQNIFQEADIAERRLADIAVEKQSVTDPKKLAEIAYEESKHREKIAAARRERNNINRLEATNENGDSVESRKRERAKKLKAENDALLSKGEGNLSQREKTRLARNRNVLNRDARMLGRYDDDDIRVSRMAADNSKEAQTKERNARGAMDYYEQNKDKKQFKGQVGRLQNNAAIQWMSSSQLSGYDIGETAQTVDALQDVFNNLDDTLESVKGGFRKTFDVIKITIFKTIDAGKFLIKNLFTVTGAATAGAASILALVGAIGYFNEKNTNYAKDLLKNAGFSDEEIKDTGIKSITDALIEAVKNAAEYWQFIFEKTFNTIGGHLAGFAKLATGAVKLLIQPFLMLPKITAGFLNLLEMGLAKIVNMVLDKVPFGMGNGLKIDESKVKERADTRMTKADGNQKAWLDSIDKAGKDLEDGFKNLGNTLTNAISDYWYRVSGEADKTIARAMLADRRSELEFSINKNLKETDRYNNVLAGGKFADVNIGKENDKQMVNVATTLKDVMGKGVITKDDLQLVDRTIDETKGAMSRTLDQLQSDVGDYGKVAEATLGDTVNRTSLSENDKKMYESYLRERANRSAKGEEYVSTNESEKKVIATATNFSVDQQKQLEDLINKQNKLKLEGKQLEKAEQEKLNQLLENRAILEKDSNKAALDALTTYQKQSEELNRSVKAVKDIEGAFNAVQNYLKNRSDVDGSNNPDATRAINLTGNKQKELADITTNFARTANLLTGEGGMTQEELLKLQKEDPEKYKQLLKDNNVDFTKAGNTSQKIAELVPDIAAQIQSNAASGFTDATTTAKQFEDSVKGTMKSALEAQGIMGEQADDMIKGLLADQNMRQTIAAMEVADHEERLNRIGVEKSVYETLRDSKILATEQGIKAIQNLEMEALDKSIALKKKQLDTLKADDTGTVDQGLIDKVQNEYLQLINQRKVAEYKNIDETTDYRIAKINQELAAYEELKQSEYLLTKEVLDKTQKLEQDKLNAQIAGQRSKIATSKRNGESPEVIMNAEIELTSLLNQQFTQRIKQRQDALAIETRDITAEYKKRAAEMKLAVANGSVNMSDNDRIGMEYDQNDANIQTTIKAQEDLLKIVKEYGGYTAEIEANLLQSRYEQQQNYAQKVIAILDNLSTYYQAIATTETTSITGSINALNNKINIYEKLAQAVDQATNVSQIGSENRDSDMSWLRENVKNSKQLADYEKSYGAAKERALMRQIELEKQAFEIQKKQQEIQTKILEIQQKRDEVQSRAELQQAAIKEQQVLADPNSTNAQKMMASATRESAQVGYESTLAQRPLIDLQKALNSNQNTIDEYSMRNRQTRALEDVRLERGTLTTEGAIAIRGQRVGMDDTPNINTRGFDVNRVQTDYSAESNAVVADIANQAGLINTGMQTESTTDILLSTQLDVQKEMANTLKETKTVIEQLSGNPANSEFFNNFENKRKNGELGGFVTAGKLNSTEEYFMTGQIPNSSSAGSSLPKVNTTVGGSAPKTSNYGNLPQQLINNPENKEFLQGVISGTGGFVQAGKLNPTQDFLHKVSSAQQQGKSVQPILDSYKKTTTTEEEDKKRFAGLTEKQTKNKKQQETAMAWLKNNQGTPNNPKQLAEYYKAMKEGGDPKNEKKDPNKEGAKVEVKPNIQITISTKDDKQIAEDTAKKIDAHLLALFTEAAKTI
jgi:hypothetical protein